MDFIIFILFFLVFLVPGLIATKIYSCILNNKEKSTITNALIFDLLILIINISGLLYIKCIYTIPKLLCHLKYIKFTSKYALLSILVGIILAVILGFLQRLFYYKRKCKKN